MTIFSIIYHDPYKRVEIFSSASGALEKIEEHARVVMNKKRLKVVLVVLHTVRSTFPERNEFIDNTLNKECEKENITADEVFFYKFRSKELA